MAKIYGLFGSMQGKVADVVMAVRNGEQIVRKYQPIVSNPKSEGQVAARAKLKLMSQLSAVMGPYIAIPKQGAVSSRNLFVKKNYLLAGYADNQATITLVNVTLTDGVVGFPGLVATRAAGQVSVAVSTSVFTGVDRVVYVAFAKQADGKLRYQANAVASAAGETYTWPAIMYARDADALVIYAYAVRDNTDAARVKFGSLQAPTAETVAKMIVTKTLLESDITLTETRGIEVAPVE